MRVERERTKAQPVRAAAVRQCRRTWQTVKLRRKRRALSLRTAAILADSVCSRARATLRERPLWHGLDVTPCCNRCGWLAVEHELCCGGQYQCARYKRRTCAGAAHVNQKTQTLFFAVSVNMYLFGPSFYTNLAVNWRLILGRLLGIFGWALRNVETCVEKTSSRSGER